MSKRLPDVIKSVFRRKSAKAVFICAALVLVSFIFVKYNVLNLRNTALGRLFGVKAVSSLQESRTARVEKGDLSVTVTGSGPVTSSNRVDIFSGESAAITKVYFKEGDRVKTGDLMYELDDIDARSSIDDIRSNIAQTQITLNSINSDMGKLKATAPVNGYITELNVREGDTIGKGAAVLQLIDDSEFKLTVQFYSFVSIKVGQTAKVIFPDSLTSINGKVSSVSDKTSATSEGSLVRNVEISIDNPGYTLDKVTARAEINAHDSVNTAVISYSDSIPVKSETGGTIKKLYVKPDQHVSSGSLLFEINSDDLVTNKETTDLKMNDFNSQLEKAEQRLAGYKVYSPISGIIVSQTANVNDSAKPGTALSTISDPERMEFSIPIDELDIAKIQVGQKANITVDALQETLAKPLAGQVSKIAEEGTSTNGVTTYPVTVVIDDTSGLKAGMNANAEIIVNQKKDILLVPLEAIQKTNGKTFVLTAGNGKKSGNDATPGSNSQSSVSRNQSGSQNRSWNANTSGSSARGNLQNSLNVTTKQVKIGINNDQYAEIISGLQEGDVVILPTLSARSSQNSNQMKGGIAPMGGFNGGIQRNIKIKD
jgi:HlyD family secretion protein